MSIPRLIGPAKQVGKAIVFVPSVIGVNVGVVVALEKVGLLDDKDLKAVPETGDVREDGDPGPRAWELGFVL